MARSDGEDTTHVVTLTPEQRKALRDPHLLQQVGGPGAPRAFALAGERLVIGRSETADIRIDSTQLSRSHAALEKTSDGYAVRDLGSSNGTYVEGVKVASAVLRDRDTLQVGDVVFEYREG